jgi:pimeloyl-ACP methyl ester carboxylesterase
MRIKHGHVELELHQLQAGEGLPLLLLHALRGSSADWRLPLEWGGPVHALDFPGHGRSDWLKGGGYYPEMFAGDADAALAHLGRSVVVGTGLGAYVALMLAGARSALVPAVLLLPGEGMEGAGPLPEFEVPFPDAAAYASQRPDGFDPLVEMVEHFVRPAEYAEELGAAAQRLLLLEDGDPRPAWWTVLRPRAEIVRGDLSAALHRLQRAE